MTRIEVMSMKRSFSHRQGVSVNLSSKYRTSRDKMRVLKEGGGGGIAAPRIRGVHINESIRYLAITS